MPDLLIELRSEEIPARMQRKAAGDLRKSVTDALVDAGLTYFHTDFRNKIEYAPLGRFNGIWWTRMSNVQRARTSGMEGNLNVRFGEQWRWRTSAAVAITLSTTGSPAVRAASSTAMTDSPPSRENRFCPTNFVCRKVSKASAALRRRRIRSCSSVVGLA